MNGIYRAYKVISLPGGPPGQPQKAVQIHGHRVAGGGGFFVEAGASQAASCRALPAAVVGSFAASVGNDQSGGLPFHHGISESY